MPKVQVEWNQDPNAVDLYQVLELVDWIKALRAEGVTGASVMYMWITRRIQPRQKRDHFGFEYPGTEDPSRLYAEELLGGEALKRVQHVLLDVHTVPYVPQLFSAANPPKQIQVSWKLYLLRVLYCPFFYWLRCYPDPLQDDVNIQEFATTARKHLASPR